MSTALVSPPDSRINEALSCAYKREKYCMNADEKKTNETSFPWLSDLETFRKHAKK